ncbi:MAG: AAA family ATPase [Acidobacteria bacterium]|nr:AAA family ATPase [Acidobacteriota bacterium]
MLVQGPPGTGKTHTIANLIGHLLAQGKRVLVTAHTSKALRVLRDKVAEPLQTLCVSVLDNDTESRKQLEASVDEMVARLTSENPTHLDREADALDLERRRLIREISASRQALIEARQDEYRDLIVAGIATSPSDAARFVSRSATQNSWISEPIEAGVPSPLSDEEVHELYSTRARLTIDDEIELRRWRPLAGEVPGGDEFARECDRWRALQTSDRTSGAQLWSEDAHWDADSEELADIDSRVRDSVGLLADAPLWKLDAVAAGMKRLPEALKPWSELIDKLESLNVQSRSSLGLLLDHRCSLASQISAETQRSLANQIRDFLERGSALTSFRLMMKPDWRQFIATARVNDGKPESAAHFKALGVFAGLEAGRRALGTRWSNQITRRGGPHWEEFGEMPEEGAALFSPTIQRLLSWHTKSQEPLIQSLKRAGFKWDEFINGHEVSPGEHMALRRLISALVDSLPKIVAARINSLQFAALERKFQRWNRALFSADPNLLPASAVLDLRLAVNSKDYVAYDLAYRRLTDLHALGPLFERCCVLLERLRCFAPQWANAIENRVPPHDAPEAPGSVAEAWKWLQYRQELQRRGAISISDIQKKIHELDAHLRRTTARVIEFRSWSAQCKRVGLEEQQALQGWKDIIRRIGRGTGQRVPGLRAEARRTLARARNAVPVWIMPLSRVAETFDPRSARFDVVIIDEASQCDVMGLLALYLARQAVVVGDHEQVSPAAVGQEITEVEHLISQHLIGIPNNRLYDGKMSLYDLARQSFGGLIRLLEHFRCVPEIISFSNHLSYNGAIKPLRDPTTTHIKPSVIPYRVAGTRGNGKINIQEARNIIALLRAAIEQPEYSGKTFGAVSLLGEEQAVQIESLARETLSPAQLVAVQFLCGTAAQFQGDERDVVFLSMVDSPIGGPLRMRQEDLFRQRFNVAASRPKDQLWVIHSLDPRRDLQPGDLRRRLIEHAENPDALVQEQLANENRTESEFERLVLDRLLRAGYRVHPQYAVGRYRIDLVVEGSGRRRLAVECDGDRFHPIEKIADDMARQAVLERIGWLFARMRGSHFFRDPDSAMAPVFERLSQLGILPLLGGADAPTHSDSSSDLLERVKRRAAEILTANNL